MVAHISKQVTALGADLVLNVFVLENLLFSVGKAMKITSKQASYKHPESAIERKVFVKTIEKLRLMTFTELKTAELTYCNTDSL